MEGGSRLERESRDGRKRGERLGSVLEPRIEPFVPQRGHDPRELRSWAKRTGFVSTAFSGETERSGSGRREVNVGRSNGNGGHGDRFDLEKGVLEKNESISPKIEIDPILGRTRQRGPEIEPAWGRDKNGVLGFRDGAMRGENEMRRNGAVEATLDTANAARTDGRNGNENGAINGNGQGNGENRSTVEQKAGDGDLGSAVGGNMYPDGDDSGDGVWHSSPKMILGLKDNPGYVPIIFYSLQHYLSLAGSLIFIPLIFVPAMGGTDKDTATVISTMLLLSGITTILHTHFGTRLPLVQGSSFVYLAPALAIMNSREFRNLTEHVSTSSGRILFTEMIENLSSTQQGRGLNCVKGKLINLDYPNKLQKYFTLIKLLEIQAHYEGITGGYNCRLNFPVHNGFQWFDVSTLEVHKPCCGCTHSCSSGLAFFSYGFPQAGACVEISLPEILLVLIFTLRFCPLSFVTTFQKLVLQVPLSVVIIWAYAFFLTAGGAYNYKGCSPDIPSSNILIDACRKHAYTMKHCRTDVSDAMRTAAWVRIPYPLQWGIPIFRLRTSIIMIFVSLVASVDSVGTYHTASIKINARAPTPGVVSRGIGLEGFCSVLAGLWGSGTGTTTLAENVHTIDITKVASRKVVEVGAVFLIVFSFIGKVGAILASIPQALAAAVLCFMWALVVALGISTLQYTQTASFRNITIVGVSLFLGLSIPAYVQQYLPESSLILPGYLIPYSAASDGPVHTGSKELDFAINALLSLNMVVTVLIAFLLDNTVPGSRQERGVYIWSNAEDIATDPSSLSDYNLPSKDVVV
ncbi:Nucleobase-ascorbate transporter 11 [Sesamum angolense]|uniref:Nucleobase-ascorbate transporter 11 n=1 Tax=Sesamum angolense TaxID=2727404 RepID=A0AAE2C7D4_9LAMI|nr:Nucleobase-ascorbate transporter 11 [Sesamum angolense]